MTFTKPRRILVIRTGGVGDFILSLPVICALREAWPEAHLELLGRPGIAALGRSLVDGTTSIDDARFARAFTGIRLDAPDPAAVYLSSFDLVVSFLGTPDSKFGRNLTALVRRTLFISVPDEKGSSHASTHFLRSLRAIGIAAGNNIPRIDLSPQDRQEGRRLLEKLPGWQSGGPPVIVHPGSGGRQKNWPPELFAQTIRLFRESHVPVLLLEGEADEAAVGSVLRELAGDPVPVLKGASLVQVAGAIACSRLVIGNDSGISHLAAAVGTPLVCLFGPTNPQVWRPLGPTVRVLRFEEASARAVRPCRI